jgi:hypothetical protein
MTTRMPDAHARSTADETVQSPLTLVLPIRSAQDYGALHATVEQLQVTPSSARTTTRPAHSRSPDPGARRCSPTYRGWSPRGAAPTASSPA